MNHARDIFVPEGREAGPLRATHLGIGAHQDDLEFMAFHGIAECFYSDSKWFGGIICTDGAGSSRKGAYAAVSDEEMRRIRRSEQRLAAGIGRYSFVAQLGYSSRDIRQSEGSPLVEDLKELIAETRPEVIYAHNPADKHPTHLRVVVAVLEALRQLPPECRPQRLYGCEMWRGLDWLKDEDKVIQDVSGHAHLAASLNGVFDSQIAGGKRYDLAVAGRREANATLWEYSQSDALSSAAFALDLSPLVGKETRDVLEFTLRHIDRFRDDVRHQLEEALR